MSAGRQGLDGIVSDGTARAIGRLWYPFKDVLQLDNSNSAVDWWLKDTKQFEILAFVPLCVDSPLVFEQQRNNVHVLKDQRHNETP
jgi:hypothetical protein